MELVYHPHDLLWVNALDDHSERPDWFSTDDLRLRPVVVRRAPTDADRIAVGIRGLQRSQRCASFVKSSAIIRVVTPEDLVIQQNWHAQHQIHPLPHWQTLEHINHIMGSYGLSWGINGSLAFELATGIPTANEHSDIDLRLLCPEPISPILCQTLDTVLAELDQRPDVQIETPNGAFAMKEWVSSPGQSVLIKSNQGPYLSSSPWQI